MAQAIPLIAALVGAGATVYSTRQAAASQKKSLAASQAARVETKVATERERSSLQADEARKSGSRRAPRGRRLLIEERSVMA